MSITFATVKATAELVDHAAANDNTIEIWRDLQTTETDLNRRQHHVVSIASGETVITTHRNFKRAHDDMTNVLEYWYREVQ